MAIFPIFPIFPQFLFHANNKLLHLGLCGNEFGVTNRHKPDAASSPDYFAAVGHLVLFHLLASTTAIPMATSITSTG